MVEMGDRAPSLRRNLYWTLSGGRVLFLTMITPSNCIFAGQFPEKFSGTARSRAVITGWANAASRPDHKIRTPARNTAAARTVLLLLIDLTAFLLPPEHPQPAPAQWAPLHSPSDKPVDEALLLLCITLFARPFVLMGNGELRSNRKKREV
jgi:hypothetical protein